MLTDPKSSTFSPQNQSRELQAPPPPTNATRSHSQSSQFPPREDGGRVPLPQPGPRVVFWGRNPQFEGKRPPRGKLDERQVWGKTGEAPCPPSIPVRNPPSSQYTSKPPHPPSRPVKNHHPPSRPVKNHHLPSRPVKNRHPPSVLRKSPLLPSIPVKTTRPPSIPVQKHIAGILLEKKTQSSQRTSKAPPPVRALSSQYTGGKAPSFQYTS